MESDIKISNTSIYTHRLTTPNGHSPYKISMERTISATKSVESFWVSLRYFGISGCEISYRERIFEPKTRQIQWCCFLFRFYIFVSILSPKPPKILQSSLISMGWSICCHNGLTYVHQTNLVMKGSGIESHWKCRNPCMRMIFFIQTVLMDICRLAVELMLTHSAFNFMQTGT